MVQHARHLAQARPDVRVKAMSAGSRSQTSSDRAVSRPGFRSLMVKPTGPRPHRRGVGALGEGHPRPPRGDLQAGAVDLLACVVSVSAARTVPVSARRPRKRGRRPRRNGAPLARGQRPRPQEIGRRAVQPVCASRAPARSAARLVAPVRVTPVARPGPVVGHLEGPGAGGALGRARGRPDVHGEVHLPRGGGGARPARSPRTRPRRVPGRSAWPQRPPPRSCGGRRSTARRRRRSSPGRWLRRPARRGRRPPRCRSPGWASRCAATGRRAGRPSGSPRPRRSAPRCGRSR